MQGSCVQTAIPGGGESLQELDDRIAAALLDIAAAYPGATAALMQLLSSVANKSCGLEASLWLSGCAIAQCAATELNCVVRQLRVSQS
jgi:broad specificity phosphatase PhoE